MVIMCACAELGPFLVGEQTTLHIGVTIWILHHGHNNEVVAKGIARPHKGSRFCNGTFGKFMWQ
jgi:hypothetical protein